MKFLKRVCLLTATLLINIFVLAQENISFDFSTLMQQGETALNDKDYAKANYCFETALKIDQESIEAIKMKNRVDEVFEKDPSIKNTIFEDIVIKGEEYFISGNYKQAQTLFLQALSLNHEAQFIKDRLASIDEVYTNPSHQQFYLNSINNGDQLVKDKKYKLAIAEYNKAYIVKPNDRNVKTKIEDAIFKQNEVEDNKVRINDLIAAGDRLFEENEFESALDKYKVVLRMVPDNAEVLQKISETENIITKRKNLQANYDRAINDADSLYLNKFFEASALLYKEAISLKPDARYPKEMLEKATLAAAEQKSVDEKYNSLIASADKLFELKDYQNAITSYKSAVEIKPEEQYPKNKISEIEGLLAEAKSLEENYNRIIEKADELYSKQKWEEALTEYSAAVELKPSEKLPAQRIDEIKGIMAQIAETELKYITAINKADSLFNIKLYESSIVAYNDALATKQNETYPKQQITEAEKLIAEQKSAAERYNLLVTEADNLFDQKLYSQSLAKYEKALEIKPNEAHPTNRISEINAIIAQIENTNKLYNAAITKADSLFGKQQWLASTEFYQKATEIKPDETYPKEQLTTANELHKNKEQLESKYNNLVNEADNLFGNKSYTEAIATYKQSLTLKPDEVYPKQQIEKIQAIVDKIEADNLNYSKLIADADSFAQNNKLEEAVNSYKEALKIKPDETYPKEKISSLQAIIDKNIETDRLYNEAISLADNFFNDKKYHEALEPYNRALTIKPDETYPNSKIAEINQILKDIEIREKEYNSILAEADENFENKMYSEALTGYKSLNKLNSNDKHVIDRISETEKILSDIEARNNAYNQSIAEANSLFEQKQYSQAIASYNKALEYKPEDKFASDKIKEINIIIAEIDKSYNLFIDDADLAFENDNYDLAIEKYESASKIKPEEQYPIKQINDIKAKKQAIINEINNRYNAHISTADSLMLAEDYNEAISYFNKALEVKPSESYPSQQISKINSLLEKIKAQRSEEFNAAIAKADNLYKNKIYDQAIEAYESAILIVPTDKYPQNQIAKIRKYLADHAIINLANQNIVVNVGDERKFNFNVIEPRLRKNNYIIIKAKAADNSKPNIFINYGKDGSKNGGVVIRDIKSGDYSEYLIRVSTQDKWYREDNNWISILAEGGEVEVSDIQIATAD